MAPVCFISGTHVDFVHGFKSISPRIFIFIS